VTIAAVCNHNFDRAREFCVKNLDGKAACFTNFAAMLEETQLDALYACIPPGAHRGEVESAAAKGIHLFLEKPIALSMERADSIAAAVRKAGVKCQMGHHMRHIEPAVRLKAMLVDGSAGKPLLFQAQWMCSRLHGDWWRDPALGGGQLLEQSIHLYDLARYFCGDADTVTGFAGKIGKARFPEYPVDDTSAATIHFRNGAIGSICASNSADPWHPTVAATVVCEKALVHFKSPDEATFLLHGGMVAEEAWKPGAKRLCEEVRSISNANLEINRNFINALRDNEPLRSSVEDGVEGLRLVLGVVKSSEQGGAPQRI
jgi:predicted dehydrogenase